MLLQSYCGPSSLQPFYYYCLNPHICGVLFYKHARLLKTQSLAPALKKEATSKSQNDQKYWIIHLRVIRISPHDIKPEEKKSYLHLRTIIPNWTPKNKHPKKIHLQQTYKPNVWVLQLLLSQTAATLWQCFSFYLPYLGLMATQYN